MISERIY